MDQMIFYGGICAAVLAFFSAVICFVIFKFRMVKLGIKMDEEYGKEEKKKKNKRRIK